MFHFRYVINYVMMKWPSLMNHVKNLYTVLELLVFVCAGLRQMAQRNQDGGQLEHSHAMNQYSMCYRNNNGQAVAKITKLLHKIPASEH